VKFSIIDENEKKSEIIKMHLTIMICWQVDGPLKKLIIAHAAAAVAAFTE
jgi:hypothetical protein